MKTAKTDGNNDRTMIMVKKTLTIMASMIMRNMIEKMTMK